MIAFAKGEFFHGECAHFIGLDEKPNQQVQRAKNKSFSLFALISSATTSIDVCTSVLLRIDVERR